MERLEHKKIYINDIKDNNEILRKIFDNNTLLQSALREDLYTDNMDAQNYEFEEYKFDGIEVRDNYNSFYIVLKYCIKFISSFNEFTGNEQSQELYNKAYKTYQEYINTDDCDVYGELYDRLEVECKELLNHVENMLHEYENIGDDNDLFYYFIHCIDNNDMYLDLYYYDDDKYYHLYEQINYEKSWC